jgi:hypothetical protein
MSVESAFEDVVKICEFYADPCETFEVDLENCTVFMGGSEISPVMENGHLLCYLVIEPDGLSHWEDDLDDYFQTLLADCWEDRS